jgi:hypothetical protein
MATLDIFRANPDAFNTRAMGEAIRVIPNQFGRIGEMNLFTPKPVRTPGFQIESKNGVLSLIQSSERGSPIPPQERGKRVMRDFRARRFARESRITADDVSGIRAFGEETELMQVMDEVNDRLEDIRSASDITKEYLRAGALRGEVRDADGSLIHSMFTEFGVSQKVVDFTLGTASTDVAGKVREVKDHITLNLLGDMMTGVHCLASQQWMDKLLQFEDVKRAYDDFNSGPNPQRDDVTDGFLYQGVMFEKYLGSAGVPQEDGSITTQAFVPDGDARFFPVGTRSTFRMFNAPADFMETVNTPGRDYYAKTAPDPKYDQWVDVMAQFNSLPVCMRPAVLVRGHSSN